MEVSVINPDGNNYTLKDTVARARIAEIEQGKGSLSEEIKTDYKWTDGKDIYVRALSKNFSVTAGGQTLVDMGIPATFFDKIIKYDAFMRTTSRIVLSANDMNARTTPNLDATNLRFSVQSSTARTNLPLEIILYYTKA